MANVFKFEFKTDGNYTQDEINSVVQEVFDCVTDIDGDYVRNSFKHEFGSEAEVVDKENQRLIESMTSKVVLTFEDKDGNTVNLEFEADSAEVGK